TFRIDIGNNRPRESPPWPDSDPILRLPTCSATWPTSRCRRARRRLPIGWGNSFSGTRARDGRFLALSGPVAGGSGPTWGALQAFGAEDAPGAVRGGQ